MSLKDLQSDKLRFCANIDVINKINKVVTNDINMDDEDSPVIKFDSQISQVIEQVSETIRISLEDWYTLGQLESDSIWINSIVSSVSNTYTSSRLVAAEAGSEATVETFIIDFTSSSGYTSEGYISGQVGSGTTSTKFVSEGDGDLIIDANEYPDIFSGSFQTGDKIFVSTNKYHKKVANIATYMSAGEVMRTISYSRAISPDESLINTFINHGKRELERLSNPYSDDGYWLEGVDPVDTEDINLGKWEEDRDRFGEWKDT